LKLPLSDSSTGELAKLIAFAIFVLVSLIAGVLKKRGDKQSNESAPKSDGIEFDLGELLGGSRRPPPPPPMRMQPAAVTPRARAASVAPGMGDRAGKSSVRPQRTQGRESSRVPPAGVETVPAKLLKTYQPVSSTTTADLAKAEGQINEAQRVPIGRSALKRFIIMAEVLGPPVALRGNAGSIC